MGLPERRILPVQDPEVQERRTSGFLTAVTIGALLVSIGIIVVVVYRLISPEPEQPLTFETVTVTIVEDDGNVRIPQVDGFAAPSITASEGAVPFLMHLCNESDSIAPGTAFTDFVVDESGERFRFADEGVDFNIEPGCQQVRFTLEMPRQMIVLVDDQQSVLPGDAVSFHMEGEFRIDTGAVANWQSESYLVVDDDPVIPSE